MSDEFAVPKPAEDVREECERSDTVVDEDGGEDASRQDVSDPVPDESLDEMSQDLEEHSSYLTPEQLTDIVAAAIEAATAPPIAQIDPEHLADIVAAAIESALAPITEQIESHQRTLDELAVVFESIDSAAIIKASEHLQSTVDGIGNHLGKHMAREIDLAVRYSEPTLIKRQRAIMNLLLGNLHGADKEIAITEFLTSGEVIKKDHFSTRVVEDPRRWAHRS